MGFKEDAMRMLNYAEIEREEHFSQLCEIFSKHGIKNPRECLRLICSFGNVIPQFIGNPIIPTEHSTGILKIIKYFEDKNISLETSEDELCEKVFINLEDFEKIKSMGIANETPKF